MIGSMINYYILSGLATNGMHEIIFGSYELEDVRFEKEVTEDYKALKIHKLDCDKQSAIDAKLLELNKAELAKRTPKKAKVPFYPKSIISINYR